MSFMSFLASGRPPLAQAFAVGESPLTAMVHLPSSPARATVPAAAKRNAAVRILAKNRIIEGLLAGVAPGAGEIGRDQRAYNLDPPPETIIRGPRGGLWGGMPIGI